MDTQFNFKNDILDLERTLVLMEKTEHNRLWKTQSEYMYKRNKETNEIEMLPVNISHAFTHDEVAPVLTLSTLLQNICYMYDINNVECFLNIYPTLVEDTEYICVKEWVVSYMSIVNGEPVQSFSGKTLIDSAYECLMWLATDMEKYPEVEDKNETNA